MFCIHILYYARQKCGVFGVGFDGEKHVDPQFLFRLICLAAVLLHEGCHLCPSTLGWLLCSSRKDT